MSRLRVYLLYEGDTANAAVYLGRDYGEPYWKDQGAVYLGNGPRICILGRRSSSHCVYAGEEIGSYHES